LQQLNGLSSVDLGTPQSWKYYLNISGQYHSTDTMMTVTSLDTLQEINFTKENLVNHSATLKAYRDSTSRYYYSLISRYPEQLDLIRGITNPVNITTAISAKDGSILGYLTELVEPQEQSLIKELEGFIQRHMVRWNVQAFGLVDSLYNSSYHAQLYLSIVPKIFNLRLQRCKTYEVHSFHIRQYLASHGGLDRYLPYMTLEQSLFFYRNINYIERNIGKTETLELLVDKILTDRQIPIAEYSIRHLNSFDEKHYPEIRARRKPINDQYNIAETNYVSTEDLYLKEDKLVQGNARYHESQSSFDDLKLKNSRSSVIQTKDLESNMVDYNDAVPDTLESVLMRQWAHMSSHNLYNVVVTFKDPKSSEYRTLFTKDALIYFNHIFLKALDIEYNFIAPVLIEKFRLPVKPSLQSMLSVIDSKNVNARLSATNLWNRQPQITPCLSSTAFFTQGQYLYEEGLKHWVTLGNTHDLRERGELECFILKLYGDVKVELSAANTPIADWLIVNNLPEYNYTYSQAQELLANIFTAATGLTVDETKLLKNIQRNMVDLLTYLSSYSIQIIREINDSKIRLLNWKAIRSNFDTRIGDTYLWTEINNRIVDSSGTAQVEGFVDSTFVEMNSHTCTVDKTVNIKAGLSTSVAYSWSIAAQMPLSPMYLQAQYAQYDSEVSSQAGFVGKEFFLQLTSAQKNSIKSIYA
jgi:hypothetical protein